MSKVYYAHAMHIYRTAAEERELGKINSRFPRTRIVNPAKYENHPEKRRDKIGFCLRLVARCDTVVFSRFRGKVTAGVGKEVNHALRIGLPRIRGECPHFRDWLARLETWPKQHGA